MSTVKHTPGPWEVRDYGLTTVEITNGSGLVICEVGNTSMEDKANARLITAGPCLLGALQEARQKIADELRSLFEGHVAPLTGEINDKLACAALADLGALLGRIDAAIAKATGQEGGAT